MPLALGGVGVGAACLRSRTTALQTYAADRLWPNSALQPSVPQWPDSALPANEAFWRIALNSPAYEAVVHLVRNKSELVQSLVKDE